MQLGNYTSSLTIIVIKRSFYVFKVNKPYTTCSFPLPATAAHALGSSRLPGEIGIYYYYYNTLQMAYYVESELVAVCTGDEGRERYHFNQNNILCRTTTIYNRI